MLRRPGVAVIALLLLVDGCGNDALDNPEDYLLELSDLPTGWGTEDLFEVDPPLDETVANENENGLRSAEVSYSKGELAPLLVHGILTTDDSDLLDERV